MRIYISISLSLFLIQCAFTQQKQVLPGNEIDQDPSLERFVNDLKTAILKQDAAWIISVLDNQVISTYGDEEGIESFRRY